MGCALSPGRISAGPVGPSHPARAHSSSAWRSRRGRLHSAPLLFNLNLSVPPCSRSSAPSSIVVVYPATLKRPRGTEEHRARRCCGLGQSRRSSATPPRPGASPSAGLWLFAIVCLWTPPHFWRSPSSCGSQLTPRAVRSDLARALRARGVHRPQRIVGYTVVPRRPAQPLCRSRPGTFGRFSTPSPAASSCGGPFLGSRFCRRLRAPFCTSYPRKQYVYVNTSSSNWGGEEISPWVGLYPVRAHPVLTIHRRARRLRARCLQGRSR